MTELQEQASTTIVDDDSLFATDADYEAAEETENHWMHWVKVICVVGKIAIVVLMMAIAIYMYRNKYQRCTTVPLLLIAYIFCLIGLIVLDMTQKIIAGFFIIILACNYLNFLGFYKILDTLPGLPGKKLQERTKWYFRVMNMLYALTLGLAFVPRFGPTCTAEKVYPACMNWAACLFIINFVFHCVINCKKDFFLNEGPIASGSTEDNFVDASNVAEGEVSKIDWTDQEKADKLSKQMFRKQMKVYLWFQGVLVVCNLAIQVWGRIFVHKSHFLGCADQGYQWIYTTITGELFIGAHMVLIITQAVMLEQALYKVPHKMGWFELSEKEVELADNFAEPKTLETKDDDFKTANAVN